MPSLVKGRFEKPFQGVLTPPRDGTIMGLLPEASWDTISPVGSQF